MRKRQGMVRLVRPIMGADGRGVHPTFHGFIFGQVTSGSSPPASLFLPTRFSGPHQIPGNGSRSISPAISLMIQSGERFSPATKDRQTLPAGHDFARVRPCGIKSGQGPRLVVKNRKEWGATCATYFQ